MQIEISAFKIENGTKMPWVKMDRVVDGLDQMELIRTLTAIKHGVKTVLLSYRWK